VSPGRPTVCLVNDSSHNPNWGCRATSRALRWLIAERGAEVVSTLYLEQLQALEPGDRRSWQRWLERLDRFVPQRPIVREVLSRSYDKLRNRLPDVVPDAADGLDAAADAMLRGDILGRHLAALAAADAVVINGEGGLYGHQRKGRLMLLLAYVAKARLGKWVGLVNHTADLADGRLRGLAERVYPVLDLVTFREPRSQQAAASISRGAVVPDAAFRFAPAGRAAWAELAARPEALGAFPDRADFDPRRDYVAVGGSALYKAVGRRGPDPGAGLRAALSGLRDAFGQVVLTASDVPDERVMRPLAEALELPLLGLATPVQQAVDVLGNATVYVGGRWHPAIFALSGGTPVVPLSSNSHKLRGLLDMFELPSGDLDALALEGGADVLVGRAEALASQGRPLRERLAGRSRELAARVGGHLDGLPGAGPGTMTATAAATTAATLRDVTP